MNVRSSILAILLALLVSACTTRTEGGPDAGGDAAPDTVVLELEPADATLTSVDGSTPSVTFRAYARTLRGDRREVEVEGWSVTDERIGVIDDAGTFVATGRAGGTIEVVARVPGAIGGPVEARAPVRVRVDLTLAPPRDAPPDLSDRFDTLPESDEPFDAAAIEYPLDGARMPNNVAPPVVQWHPRESPGDAYRIVVEGEHVIVRGFTWDGGRTFDASWSIAPELWRVVADSARGGELQVRVDRIPSGAGEVVIGAPVTIWLSEDGIFGTLFYLSLIHI